MLSKYYKLQWVKKNVKPLINSLGSWKECCVL